MLMGVPLFHTDIQDISGILKTNKGDFINRYCDLIVHKIPNNQNTLRVHAFYLKLFDSRCIFYENNGCAVNDVKPYLCKTAPFISLLFQDSTVIDNFKKRCKGFGHGPYYNKKTIKFMLKQEAKLEKAEWELFNNGFYDNLMKKAL